MKNAALLISSYDRAECLWRPLEKSYQKYWPDINFKIYLATNNISPDLGGLFNILKIGYEKSWSDNMLKCLDLIEEEYIILSFDDLFLFKKIDNSLVNLYYNDLVKNNWDYLRLHPSPKPDYSINKYYGKIAPNRPYRCSTVFSFFKKTTLQNLLVDTESAWEFENNASIRSNNYENFYVSKKVVIPYLNAIVKGKWIPPVYKNLKKEGFISNLCSFPIMTKSEYLFERIKRIKTFIFLNLIPKKNQLNFRNFLRKF